MRQDARSRVVAVLPGLCRETPKSHCFGLCTNPIRDRLPLVYLEIFFWAHPQIVDIRAKRISGFKHLLYSLFPYCPNYHHHHNHHFSLLNIIQLPLHFAEICPSISSSLIPSNTHTHTRIYLGKEMPSAPLRGWSPYICSHKHPHSPLLSLEGSKYRIQTFNGHCKNKNVTFNL